MAKVNSQNVAKIIELIGGKENIKMATHCVTRLRFILEDESKVDATGLGEIDIVKGSFSANGQYQVVIGQGTVDKAYEEVIKQTGLSQTTKEDSKAAAVEKLNPVQRLIKNLADIFIPILPAIVTAGLLLGINNVLTGGGIFGKDSLVTMYPGLAGIADLINMIASTAFAFLPALIGWSTVKKFGGNPLLGIVLGLVMVNPSLMSAYKIGQATPETWNIFGLLIDKVGYQGQVLPTIVSAYILAKIEVGLKKVVPDSIQLLVVAPVALLATGFLTFLVVGPVTYSVASGITGFIVWLFKASPIIAGLIYGGTFAAIVVTGMHHAFLAVNFELIASTGATFLWPIAACSDIAQGSAALAMSFLSKNSKERGMAVTATSSAYLGVTEPAVFGVNLRFKFPFYCALAGSGVAGMILMMNSVVAPSIGVSGLLSFLAISRECWGAYFVGMAIAFIVPFAGTLIVGKIMLNKNKEIL